MVDFLMFRLPGALQEPWMQDVVDLRRSVIAGPVFCADLRVVVTDLISVWDSVREYVRYTSPPHTQTQTDRVSVLLFLIRNCMVNVCCDVVTTL